MHPDNEYDPDLHRAALEIVRDEGPVGQAEGMIVAEAYLDLIERRGLPPILKCYPSIQLQSGVFYDFMDPDSSPIDPLDIVAGLSKMARCTGQTLGDEPYTIAQHCCHASDAAEGTVRKFKALMHDAPESVLGDVATPLKQLLVDYKAIEKRVSDAFARQFNLNIDFEDDVKDIDLRMAATEKRDIMPAGEWSMLEGIEPYDFEIIPWTHSKAKIEWLSRFHRLYQDYLEHLAEIEEFQTSVV